ncbi:MAG TPA: acyl-CoA dehydrogenase family protein [Acidimicrobiia bacterium]
MDFSLSDEQQALQGLARQILGDRMTPARLKEVEAGPEWFDRETWAELAKANLLGVAVPEEHGGLGYGFLELCLVLQEQGRTAAPLPLLATLVMGALPIARFGSKEQQARLLPGVVSGLTVLTAALNEVGAPPESPTTVAVSAGNAWRVDGTKICVPAAHLADAVLVPARTDDGVAVFLVDPKADGVTLERQDTLNLEPQFEMTLRGVTVEAAGMLGTVADGAVILDWLLARSTAGLCAIAAGVSHEALHQTAQYTTERKQFDRAIGTFQAVGQRMADAYIDAQGIELTMLQAASHLDGDESAPLDVASAKFWASEAGSRVVHAALHVHGGISIDLDYPIHRYFLWAKQIEFSLGSETEQLRRIGAILAAEPAPPA